MLTLLPAKIEHELFYVGELTDETVGLTHIFGFSCEVTCLSKGKNILAIPLPSRDYESPTKVISNNAHRAFDGMLRSVSGIHRQKNVISQLDHEAVILPNAAELSRQFQSTNGISSFSRLLGEFYPGCQMFSLGFEPFEGKREISALMWYVPNKKRAFFLPTFVGNNESTNFDLELRCDYWAFFSTERMVSGVTPIYDETLSSEMISYLPESVIGKRFEGWYKNADTVSSVEGIEIGLSDAIHRRPFWGLWHG